ncbi:hypothetical protein TIFTF001_002576 [Ficus carica]|uniref:TF-B3 domain-containing protein n=1 Tax=Ficus carica TaxID=3494 RepID=A0AA88CTQ2_FICCA|nr:hypothetical protein TIFTF001_002576 [Ficus carica]
MTCRPRNDLSTFSTLSSHFFSVVLENTLRDKRLLIPVKFISKYGGTLSNPVSVKLPCGSEWKMGLRKFDGRVCLHKGWPEFVKHYSIALGHLLVFRYEGNSRFHVFIFDKTTVEIDYPPIPGHSNARKSKVCVEEGHHGDKSIMSKRRESEVGNFTYKVVIKPSHVGNYYNMCLPRKFANEFLKRKSQDAVLKLKDGGTWPVKFSGCRRDEICRSARFGKIGWEKFARDNNLKVGDTCIFELINGNKMSFKVSILKADLDSHHSHAGEGRANRFKLKRNVKANTNSGYCKGKHQKEPKTEIGESGESGATKPTRRFSSKYPFFEKTVISSYLDTQRVPRDFGRSYFQPKTQTAKLQMGKKSWSVKVRYGTDNAHVLSGGWSSFARENSLHPGDVCVFELIKVNDIVLKVTIFKKELTG